MKKIGFVDYYLSEWHANNYPGWIKEADPEYEIAYAWAELDVSPRDGVTTAEWCEKFGATPCATLEELCEKSDVILILSPSNAECHLPYAKAVLPYGKRTYIDKTFTPTEAEAREIFAIAKKYNTPFFSTSALRYAEELDAYGDCRMMMTTGGGADLAEYLVHQVEMIVRKLGMGADRIRASRFANGYHFQVSYPDGREAMMIFDSSLSFFVTMSNGKKALTTKVTSPFFNALIADILRFYDEGTVSFDPAETIEVMRVREAALRAMNTLDEWIMI